MTASPSLSAASPPPLVTLAALVSRRLGLAMSERFAPALAAGLAAAGRVLAQPDEAQVCAQLDALPWTAPAWQAVIDCVTVRETTFLRHRAWWTALTEAVLRPLIAARRQSGHLRLSCLSIGCATGEEPYSLALVLDRLIGSEPGWTITLTGTDLCTRALAAARTGRYCARALRELSPRERERWFQPEGDGEFRLDPRLRERVQFLPANLMAAADVSAPGPAELIPGAPADVVLCRNVLIHLDPARQPVVARHLASLVAEGGSLAVAPVEATAARFAPLDAQIRGSAILFSRPARLPSPVLHPADPPAGPAPLRQTAAGGTWPPAVLPDVPARSAGAGDRVPAPAGPETPATTPADSLERACRLADRGLFAEARRLCGEALAGSVEADLLMALVSLALGDVAGARLAAERGVAAAPEDPAAHYVRAILWLHTGHAEEARQSLQQAVTRLAVADDRDRVSGHLAIEAGHIRQAARRLGVAKGGPHVRAH